MSFARVSDSLMGIGDSRALTVQEEVWAFQPGPAAAPVARGAGVLVHGPALVADIVREEEFAQPVGGSEVGLALVDARELLHELLQRGVGGEHEGGDRDAGTPAGARSLEG